MAKINKLYDRAGELAIELIEFEARQILKKHSNLNEFIMCMGSSFFTDKNNDPIGNWELKYLKPFNDMVDELNEKFNILGHPMRFTANGKVKNNW
jgi:hypothetical protein